MWLARKRLQKDKAQEKKALIGQRQWKIDKLGGMQNHNGPACDGLLPVPVVVPVLFPAVAVR